MLLPLQAEGSGAMPDCALRALRGEGASWALPQVRTEAVPAYSELPQVPPQGEGRMLPQVRATAVPAG
jgi:hypothetical protein